MKPKIPQENIVQENAVQENAVQENAVQENTVQENTVIEELVTSNPIEVNADIYLEIPAKSQTEATSAVILISDPFQISNNDILEAQNSENELELDEPNDFADVVNEPDDPNLELLSATLAEFTISETPTETPEEANAIMERLASAILQEQEKQIDEMQATQGETAEEAALRLSREILEDEALTKYLASSQSDDEDTAQELLDALPQEPEVNENGDLDLQEIESCIESLLFMSDKPLSANKLRDLLGPEMSLSYFQEGITNLIKRYQRLHHGMEIVKVAGGFQFRTKPARAILARKLAKVSTQKLSSGAMETMAIIAFKQPVLKDEIDKIRGVDSSHFLRGLLEKKLIKIAGRSELPGRPMVYETTDDFLQLFGLPDLSSLPPLREIEQMIPASQSGQSETDPRIIEMRELIGQMNSDTSVNLLYNPKDDEIFLNDIREKVKSIEISTPALEAQKADEEAVKQRKKLGELAQTDLGDSVISGSKDLHGDLPNGDLPG